MKNQIQYIVDELYRPSERKLVILMTSTHPMTDRNLCLTGHSIYNLELPQFPIKWEGNVPENMTFINQIEQLPHRPDIVLSQNIVDQYPVFKQLSYMFDAPLVEFEHTVPSPEWMQGGVVEQIKNSVAVDGYVFITDFSRNDWGHKNSKKAFTLYHMVDTDFYKGWTGGNGRVATMCNAFASRVWAVGNIAEFMTSNDKVDLFGNNPGYESRPLARRDVPITLSEYDIYLNTSLRSPIPASLIEAAAIGMPIVSTKTCAIPDIFTDGENIRFFETMDEANTIIAELLEDKAQRKRLGAAAREKAVEAFSEKSYTDQWDRILMSTIGDYHYA